MKRQFPGIACDGTKPLDALLNGNYFVYRKIKVRAAALSCHNKATWMDISVRHTAVRPDGQSQTELVSSKH